MKIYTLFLLFICGNVLFEPTFTRNVSSNTKSRIIPNDGRAVMKCHLVTANGEVNATIIVVSNGRNLSSFNVCWNSTLIGSNAGGNSMQGVANVTCSKSNPRGFWIPNSTPRITNSIQRTGHGEQGAGTLSPAVIVLVVVLLVLVTMAIVLIFMYCRGKLKPGDSAILREMNPHEFSVPGVAPSSVNDHGNTTVIEIEMTDISKESAQKEYYSWREITRESLAMGDTLGRGEFGLVVKAIWTNDETKAQVPVAVKTLKENATETDHKELFKELTLMAEISEHPNVVNLIGACSKEGPLWIIFELCEHGNLLRFLRENRQEIPDKSGDFSSSLDPLLRVRIAYDVSKGMRYLEEEKPSGISGADEFNQLAKADHAVRMFGWDGELRFGVDCGQDSRPSFEICKRGKDHLTDFYFQFNPSVWHNKEWTLNIVHRDLAARNVLLGENKIAKISDFGLSRDVYTVGLYQKNTGGKLPVRWMAIESLKDATYTSKSDVWSFGVLFWEIESAGLAPYPGMGGWDILNFLSDGCRLEQPSGTPLEIYKIMKKCWELSPKLRPHFAEIESELEGYLEERSDYLPVLMEEQLGGVEAYINYSVDLEDEESL